MANKKIRIRLAQNHTTMNTKQLNIFLPEETPHERLTRLEQEYEDKLWKIQKEAHAQGKPIPLTLNQNKKQCQKLQHKHSNTPT